MLVQKMRNVVYPLTQKRQNFKNGPIKFLKIQVFVLALTVSSVTMGFAMEDKEAQHKGPTLSDAMIKQQQDIDYHKAVFAEITKPFLKLQADFNDQKSSGLLKNFFLLNDQIGNLENGIKFDGERLVQIGGENPKIQSRIEANNIILGNLCNQRKEILNNPELRLFIDHTDVELKRIGKNLEGSFTALIKCGVDMTIENIFVDLQNLQVGVNTLRQYFPVYLVSLPAELIASIGKTSGNILNLTQTCKFMNQVPFGKVQKVLTLPSNFGTNPEDLETSLICDDIHILNFYNVSREGLQALGLLADSSQPLCQSMQRIFVPSSFCISIVFNKHIDLSYEFTNRAQNKIEKFPFLPLNETIMDEQLRIIFHAFTRDRAEGSRLMVPLDSSEVINLVSLAEMLCSLKNRGHYRDVLTINPPDVLIEYFNKISTDVELKEIVDAALDLRLCHLDDIAYTETWPLWSSFIKLDRENALKMFKKLRIFIPEYDNNNKYYWPTSEQQAEFYSSKKIFLPLLKGISIKGRNSVLDFQGYYDLLGFKIGTCRSDLFTHFVFGLSKLDKVDQYSCLEKVLKILTIEHVKESSLGSTCRSEIPEGFQFAFETCQLTFANYNMNDLDSFTRIMKRIGVDINPLEMPISRERYEELLSMINKFTLFLFINVSDHDHVVRFLVLDQYKNFLGK